MLLFRNISIQKKLSLIAFLTCVTALSLVSVALLFNEVQTFRRNLVVDIGGQARTIAGMSAAALAFDDQAAVTELLADLKVQKNIDQVTLFKDGQLFARSQRVTNNSPAHLARLEHVEPLENSYKFQDGRLFLHRNIEVRGKTVGRICIIANTDQLNFRLMQYGVILLVVFVLATSTALALTTRLQSLIVTPVLDLSATAKIIAEKNDYSVRAEMRGNDEVGQLTAAFNLMLSRIQTQDAALNLSQAKLEALVNSILGIVWEWDPVTAQYTFVSRQCERILGHPMQQWLGNSDFHAQVVHPDDLSTLNQIFRDALKQRAPFSHQFRVKAADQRIVWLQANGVVQLEREVATMLRGIFIDVTEQKLAAEKLARLNEEMAKTQRQAGMAEVATGVLHNVGNVLNSINVSAALLRDQVGKSQILNFVKATSMLRDHAADTAQFLINDPKGQKLPAFFIKLGERLAAEQNSWQKELDGLGRNIEHIKEIVSMQQSYARLGGVSEAMNAAHLTEDALRMNEAALARHGIKVVREFTAVPAVTVDKHKVLQILINLIRNAKYAMDATGRTDKILIARIISIGPDRVAIQIQDNGIGINPENLTRIFQHGFTTKKEGHGFGLHSSANAAREMRGNLKVHSDGPGCGAVFTLELMCVTKEPLPFQESEAKQISTKYEI